MIRNVEKLEKEIRKRIFSKSNQKVLFYDDGSWEFVNLLNPVDNKKEKELYSKEWMFVNDFIPREKDNQKIGECIKDQLNAMDFILERF